MASDLKTFAHIRTASNSTGVLWAGRIDPSADLEKPGGIPFCAIRDDLLEHFLQAFLLRHD